MPIHDGHRQRMKERFRNEGLDNFDEHQVLELLLFYTIPQKDTNPLAHRLIRQFGGLVQVLEAPAEELKKVDGISDASATFLSLITEVGRYYLRNRSTRATILTTIEACGEYLAPFFHGRRNETVYLLCLDAKCKVLCCRELTEGSVTSANVSVRKVVETALSVNASSVVLAHNHPSGLAIPSAEDVQTTRRVAAALEAVEVTLVDHLIVADEDYVSLVQSGLYRQEDCRMML